MESFLRSDQPEQAPYTTIPNLLKKWAIEDPDGDAFIVYYPGDHRRTISHGELYEKAVKLAKGLLRLGIGRSDVIGIGGSNSIEYLISMFAVQMTRAKPLHLTFHQHDGDDIKRMINIIGHCTMLMFDPGTNDKHWKIVSNFVSLDLETGQVSHSDIPGLKWITFHLPMGNKEKCFTIDDLYYNGEDINLPHLDPDDVAAILSTSGSTGFPKAVEYSHYSAIWNGHNFKMLLSVEGRESKDLTLFNDRPFYWVGGYPQWEIVTGGTRITLSNQLALPTISDVTDYTMQVLRKESPEIALIQASFLHELVKRKDDTIKLKSVLTGGQPVSSSCLEGIGICFDKVAVAYASVEFGQAVGHVYDASTKTSQKYLGGKPLPGVEVKVVDENGLMVNAPEIGEIYIRTPRRFSGYINNEEKTKTVLLPFGWFKTDDVGKINSENFLEVSGRRSDVIQIAAWKIAPSFIEDIIRRHKDVSNVIVFGTLDEATQDSVICAAIQKTPGSDIGVQAIKDFVKKEVNIYDESALMEQLYVPRHVVFINDLPQTSTGKPDRKTTKLLTLPLIENMKKTS